MTVSLSSRTHTHHIHHIHTRQSYKQTLNTHTHADTKHKYMYTHTLPSPPDDNTMSHRALDLILGCFLRPCPSGPQAGAAGILGPLRAHPAGVAGGAAAGHHHGRDAVRRPSGPRRLHVPGGGQHRAGPALLATQDRRDSKGKVFTVLNTV